jgi:hypothetical protein
MRRVTHASARGHLTRRSRVLLSKLTKPLRGLRERLEPPGHELLQPLRQTDRGRYAIGTQRPLCSSVY